MIERIRRKIRAFLISHSKDARPSSTPFVSGDGFRKMASHIYDETGLCKSEDICEHDVVFVKGDMLDDFFRTIHPEIRYRYTLITHNSDRNISEKELAYLDEKIVRWFAQNVLVFDPRLIPIPIGLENAHFGRALPPRAANKNQKRLHRTLVNFSIETNTKERSLCLEEMSRNPHADVISKRIPQSAYDSLLSLYAFIASPAGGGIDCHRTWEALYRGSIPIVKRSAATTSFEKIGLPLMIVDDWKEIETLDFEKEYIKRETMSGNPALFLPYWENAIKERL